MEHKDGDEIKPKSAQTPLTSDKIIQILSEEKPSFKSRFDAVAFALHVIMRELGFRCVAIHDSRDETANEKYTVEGWNHSTDAYSFTYKHSKSSMTFVIKSLVMGDQLLVNGLGLEDKKIHSTEIDVNTYTKDKVPLDDYKNLFQNLNKLMDTFKKSIVTKLLPSSTTEAPEATTSTTQSQQQREDPLRIPTNRPQQPYPYPYSPLMEPPPQPLFPVPFGGGQSDVFPLPGPFEGPQGGGRGGNLIGPNHPGFGPFVTDPYGGSPFGRGRGRGRGGHPPGARFDPFGPPTTNFGEPDSDEFDPPTGGGYDDYFG